MKAKINSLPGAVLGLLLLTLTANAATQVYDLKTDWSDTQNPNGAWSFWNSYGTLLLNDPFSWTYSCESLEAIARTTEASIVPGVFELGDIVLELGSCGMTLRWTAPANGTINVSGNSWGCSGLRWALKYNGTTLTGEFSDGGIEGHTRDLPYQFSSGSGGATALQNIAVQAGDQVEITLSAYLRCFDFWQVGLNFSITLTTDSFDPVAAIENLATTVCEMNLQNGIENSLDSKLDAALKALEDANVSNDAAACNSLQAFISAVEAQRGNQITSAQADQLVAAAEQIQSSLNCGN